ncbi:hypothetical protein GDO81_007240 [Engystomops pustulosus]|uniref:Uncharacterized protein n=1 Tax=Engystomops pustulosus TaxID=76066 RepID=A0AAV7C6L4_ENGPU|nr:hypothetical protein GDO81_007240 [Engystomops pustulosus]
MSFPCVHTKCDQTTSCEPTLRLNYCKVYWLSRTLLAPKYVDGDAASFILYFLFGNGGSLLQPFSYHLSCTFTLYCTVYAPAHDDSDFDQNVGILSNVRMSLTGLNGTEILP